MVEPSKIIPKGGYIILLYNGYHSIPPKNTTQLGLGWEEDNRGGGGGGGLRVKGLGDRVWGSRLRVGFNLEFQSLGV